MKTQLEIANRLRQIADEMAELAINMDYFGGFARNQNTARDLADICIYIHQTAAVVEAENPPH